MNTVSRLVAAVIGVVGIIGSISLLAAQDEVLREKVTTGAIRAPAHAGEVSLHWGHLGLGDHRLTIEKTLYEDREILLTPGMTYHIEVRARAYRPHIWIQRTGKLDPDRAIFEDWGQWEKRRWPSPLVGRVRNVGEAELDFRATEDEYLLVINTTRSSDVGFYRVTIRASK